LNWNVVYFVTCLMKGRGVFLKLKENWLIIILALVFAFALFYVIKNPWFFQASVLSLSEINTIKENKWDMAYKNENWLLDIFVSSELKNLNKIDLSIIFDSKKVIIDLNALTWQWFFQVKKSEQGLLDLSVSDLQNLNKSASLIIIPFSWDNTDIILGESIIYFNDWQNKQAAIGNLTQTVNHQNL